MNERAHTSTLLRAAPARVLACGAFLKNRACLIEGDRVHWSALHGDLGDGDAREALRRSVASLLAQARGPLKAVAHDLHPDFFSTHLALETAQRLAVPALGVQHHHAHLGVVIAEQGLQAPVVGWALDGMGLGSDGGAWGGELLRVGGGERASEWRRLGHLPPLALPGGDAAAREPWRMAASVLFALGRADEIEPRFSPRVGAAAASLMRSLLERGFQCPPSSSAGRWFDAAAGALGVSQRQSHEAEAAMALEALAREWLTEHPVDGPVDCHFTLGAGRAVPGLAAPSGRPAPTGTQGPPDLHAAVAELFDLAGQGLEAQRRGAAQFHLVLAEHLAGGAIHAAATQATRDVVLAGGCLANRVLREALSRGLEAAGLRVHLPAAAGCGDAGLALGQAWIAACVSANLAVDAPAQPRASRLPSALQAH